MMFSSLDDNVGGYSDIIFGDNSQGKVKGVGTIPISSNHSLSKVLLVDSLKFNLERKRSIPLAFCMLERGEAKA